MTTNVDERDPLLDRRAAADYLGVKPETLSAWACTGRYGLAFVKVGRLVKYRKSTLDQWLAARTRNVETVGA